ncbi:hypothetical protein NL518_28855, partial [Klebsiella pneumoniae]|nr:hypothetical protein [Klebsiella pneumoniae]
GEVARFDITDRDGKVIVQKDKRINAKHIRDLEAAKTKFISVPEDYLLGRPCHARRARRSSRIFGGAYGCSHAHRRARRASSRFLP